MVYRLEEGDRTIEVDTPYEFALALSLAWQVPISPETMARLERCSR